MVAARYSVRRELGVALMVVGALMGPSVLVAAPAPAAQVFMVEGTNIGDVPTDAEFAGYVGSVLAGVGPGSGYPDSDAVADGAIVAYPASFWPVSKGGLGDPTWNRSVAEGVSRLAAEIAASGEDRVLIAGQSQGAVVLSQYKAAHPAPSQDTSYLLISNPGRPNGGFLERFEGLRIPILDVTMTGATPAAGGTTFDVGLQYDGWSDFPKYPLNILATINAIAGMAFIHGVKGQVAQVNFADLSDPTKVDIIVDGDTTYYTVPTSRLPMLKVLEGFVPDPILTALDAPLRVIVEWGYDRETSPGTPTGASVQRAWNPVQDMTNLAAAVAVGLDNGIAQAANDPSRRPFGTAPAGMYGVGGRQISSQSVSAQKTIPIQQNSRDLGHRKAGFAGLGRTAHQSAG